jgi:hypothetical protein
VIAADDEAFNIMALEGIMSLYDINIDKCFDGNSLLN